MNDRAFYKLLIGSVLAIAVAMAGAGIASAAPVVLSSTGNLHSSGAALDGAGNLHVVWADTSGGSLQYRYCRIPADASACAPTDPSNTSDSASWTFEDAPRDTARAYAFFQPPDTIVLAVSGTLGAVDGEYTITSSDDGMTFGAPTLATTVPEDDAVWSNGAAVLGVGGVSSLLAVYDGYQLGAFDGTAGAATTGTLVAGTIGGLQAMALDSDGRPLAVVKAGDSNALEWTKFTGSAFTVSSLTNDSNWSPAAPVPVPAAEGNPGEPSLSSGPRGLFLSIQGNEHIFHYDTATSSWQAPTVPPVPAQRLAEDSAGRLYGYGSDQSPDLTTECYSHTDPSGANPTPLATLPVPMNPNYSHFVLPPGGGGGDGGWLVGATWDRKLEAVPLRDATPNSSCGSGSTTGGPPPPPGPGAPRVYLRGSFRVKPNGSFSFRFGCPAGGARCTGTVTVTVVIRFRSTARTAKASASRIATARIGVAPGRVAAVRVRINRAGRKLLARHHTVHATITVASRVGTGAVSRTRRRVNLTLARRR
jgi:hypothetical protein